MIFVDLDDIRRPKDRTRSGNLRIPSYVGAGFQTFLADVLPEH